uniref:Reverse transcriptase domain-containing protein n=1 Tax=Trichogramma kaykai TaxID=54128 RepID=A0ABD2WT81_9HYME
MTLITELGQLAQRDSESVFDYSERLGDLTDELKIAESRDKSGIAITEACLIETFVSGLKQDIITRMPKTTTLGDAFCEAQRIEKILMAEKELRSKNSTAKGCVFCNTTSHETLACEVFLAIKRKNTPAPDTGEARVDNAYYTPCVKEKCRHCGSEEHSLNNCKIFFSANIKSEKKEPEVISEKEKAHENDKNASELSKSCSTRSWQDGAATRLYEQNGSIDTHVDDKKQINTLEITESSKSGSSLVILAPQRIFFEENKDNSKVAEVNTSVASPCICKGKKADDTIENLRNDKKVAAIFEDNDFEMIESVKSEEKIEEIFNVIDPCDETYESYMIDTDDMNYCYERMLQIDSKFENTSERVYKDNGNVGSGHYRALRVTLQVEYFPSPEPADKNGKKRYRLVVDFRALNEKTIPDRYPLPNILDIIDQVGGAKYFSTLDLSNGFYQVLLKEEDRHKTAFSTEFGLFHFKKLPMGCSNAPATFQRAMDNAFRGMQQKEIFLYLDDAVI